METLKAHPILAIILTIVVVLAVIAALFLYSVGGPEHLNNWWAINIEGETYHFMVDGDMPM